MREGASVWSRYNGGRGAGCWSRDYPRRAGGDSEPGCGREESPAVAHLVMEVIADAGVMTILDRGNASAGFAVELVQSAFGKKIL
jgi:hypothetical protein